MNVSSLASPRFPRLQVLLSLLVPHKKTLTLGFVLGLIATAMGLATPLVTKWVLDSLAVSASLMPPVVTLLGLLVVGTVITLWQWILLGTLAEQVVLEARESMVRRFFRAKVQEITRRQSGELVTRVTSDTVLLREAASSSIINLINGVIALVGTLILMAVLDLWLLAATVGSVLIVAILVGTLMPRIAKEQERAQAAVGRLGGALEGGVRAIRTVKASRAETRQTKSIVDEARTAADHSIRATKTSAWAWSITWAGVQLAIIVILGLGAWRVGLGLLEVSSLIAFLLYAFQLMGPVTELTQNVTALQAGIAAAGRIREVQGLELETDTLTTVPITSAVPAADREDAAGTDSILVLDGVVAKYHPEAEPAVRGVSFAVPRRGHTAIVGPSGAGKTTVLSLILRFLEPQQGTIQLAGRPYSELTHDEIRSRIAYVEQETPIVPGTIRDNLTFTHPDATALEIDAALRAVRLDDKIDSLEEGLDTSLTSSSVSGGQRQRIALARAILRTPELLLLDEATAQVDGITEAAIHDAIRERARHGAVITIAHRLSTIVDADTILVMENGLVRAAGTHHQLLETDELYRDLVAALRIGEIEVSELVTH